MKKTISSIGAAALLPLHLAAQGLQPPEPGLWEQDVQMLINGQDMMAQMRAMQAQMMQNLPPQVRQQMAGSMGPMGGPQPFCLSAQQAARAADPQQIMRDLQREQPNCRFQPVGVQGATVRFQGRCEDPQGFTGDVAGKFTQNGARASSGHYTGKGRVAGMPGAAAPGLVDMRMNFKARWVRADCGSVRP